MLVLAVSVSVVQNVVGRVRLIATDTEIQPHVMKLQSHEVVQGVNSFVVAFQPLGQLSGLAA